MPFLKKNELPVKAIFSNGLLIETHRSENVYSKKLFSSMIVLRTALL